MDTFTTQYIETALWSSIDDKDQPMDKDYSRADLAPETLQKMKKDCQAFQERAGDLILSDLERAGHDFWLTRNRHGAGFWDGDWPEADGEKLTELSKTFGQCDLYVGDDGRIYC